MIQAQYLRRHLDAAKNDGNPERFFDLFKAAINAGEIKPEEISLRGVFEHFVDNGRELIESFNPQQYGNKLSVTALEAAGAVSTSDFSNITNVLISKTVMVEFENPALLFDKVCTVMPTSLNGERIGDIGVMADEMGAIGEGEAYPVAGLTEDYIQTPATTKRGVIVPVTKEAIFFDQTGKLLQRAANVAQVAAMNREKRMLDVVFGITNPFMWRNTTYNTYQSTQWTNTQSNALVDYTDIENSELLFDAMTDPNSGEPIVAMATSLIVPTALKNTAFRIMNSTEVRVGDGASGSTQTISANPVRNSYEILSTPYVKSRSGSASTWFHGNPKKAFAYMQNWPPTVVKAPVNSEAEFTQDIVDRYKISERGAAAVMQPRFMVKNT